MARGRLVRGLGPTEAPLTARGRRQVVAAVGLVLLTLSLVFGGDLAAGAEADGGAGGGPAIGFVP